MYGFGAVAENETKQFALWAYSSRRNLSNEKAQARAAEPF
jgi:hypothetical protein